jgi:hypothetical protein
MIGNDFCIFSGFLGAWFNECTPRIFCKNLRSPSSLWREKDPLTSDLSSNFDLSKGISHAGYVAVGSKVYLCGGVCCAQVFRFITHTATMTDY